MLVVPGTGAYGHSTANNFNAVPRPPVVFCRDGEARVVVRRETLEDVFARDVVVGDPVVKYRRSVVNVSAKLSSPGSAARTPCGPTS